MSSSATKAIGRSGLLREIADLSILKLVPGLMELALQKGDVRVVAAGTVLCRQHDEVSHLILPLGDGIVLQSETPGEAPQPLGRLKSGRTLALRNLLERRPYDYSAVAESTTSVLLIPARSFLSLLEGQPLIAHYLRCMVSSEAMRRLKALLSERRASQEEILEAFSYVSAEVHALDEGQTFDVSEPQLFFIESGEVLIAPFEDDAELQRATVGRGTLFGGEALVAPHVLSYEVFARSHVEYRRARLRALEPLLRRFGLVDHLYGEPWLPREPRRRRDERRGRVSELPGRVISEDEALRAGLSLLSPARTARARSDEESVLCSVENVATLLGRPVNRTSLQTELSFGTRFTRLRMVEGDRVQGGVLAERETVVRVTFLRIAEALEPHGVQARALVTEPRLLARQSFPALAMFGPRLCVLLRANRRAVYLLDPARGVVLVPLKELARHWDGALLEVRPHEDPERAPVESARGERSEHGGVLKHTLRRVFAEYAWPLVNMMLLAIATFGLGLLSPRFSQMILDEVLTLRDTVTLVAAVSGLVVVTVFSIGLTVARSVLLAEIGYRLDQRISSRFYGHALSLPTSYFAGRRAGKVLTRLMELWSVRSFVSGATLQAFADFFAVVLFAGILFWYGSVIALIPLATLVLISLVHLFARRSLARYHEDAFEADSLANSLLAEQVGMVTTVKAMGAEESMRHRWEEAYVWKLTAQRRAEMATTAIEGVTGFFAKIMVALGIWAAATRALKGELSPGEVLAVSMYLQQIAEPTAGLARIISSFERVRVAFRKVSDVLEASPEQPPGTTSTSHSLPLRGKIRFEDVSFRYDDDSPWVLKNLSFSIYPKQIVAIVGKSGCGKSTLLGLISGALRPTSGRIFFDDLDSSFLSLPALRKQLGFIVQQRELFSGTVGENITYADDAPDDEQMERATADANALDFVEKLPQGFGYYLAEGGLGLSGGQRQRLSIARTLYREPRILLMDEATSALDMESERKVMERMREIMAGKTTIVIAHRLSTIRQADNVLVIKDGTLVEEGTHMRLMEAGGHYYELFGVPGAAGEGT